MSQSGFSLVELMVAMTLSAIMMLGLVQIAAAARDSFRLQEGLAGMQESSRFALESVGNVLQQAVFEPRPWMETGVTIGITAESTDNLTAWSDRLGVRGWSDRNCFGAPNTAKDAQGRAAFYLKESVLNLNRSKNLAHTCRYGTSPDTLVTQIDHEGMVEDVDNFQVLYAVDTDFDRYPDRWVTADDLPEGGRVLGLQLALLVRSRERVVEPAPRFFSVLDKSVRAPADGRLRRVITYSQALRGRGAGGSGQ